MLKEILTEASGISCMRFCVTAVVITILFNWTMGSFAVILGFVDSAGISGTEVAALVGVLATKMGQKKLEK